MATSDRLKTRLNSMNKRDLLEIVQTMDALEKELDLKGPQTNDDLHKWIYDQFDINIPRIAVCEGHCAPFDFLADLFFVRTTSAMALANRGGAKTFMVALLHRCNAEFKTKVESLTGGATEAQSKRCFAHLDKLVNVKNGEKSIISKTKTEILWRNGCKTEIVAGTPAAFNGPHPHIVHVDEQEIMDPLAFAESRNCAQSSNVGGKIIQAQDIITSTRKWAIGPMQSLLDDIQACKVAGTKPPYDLYTWCIFEVAQPNKKCQIAYPEGNCGKCDCDKISKGEWDDGTTRYLTDVCQGKFARSDGWVIWDDVVRLFKNNSREVWEAQQQCSRPSTSGIVLPQFSLERNGIQGFQPDPDNGPIYQGIDFGATNPNAVLWVQVLRYDVEALSTTGNKIILKEGSRVFFDEYYMAEIPNVILGDNIVRKERIWREIFPTFSVKGRFADPQGRSARLDLLAHVPSIPTTWHTNRDVAGQIKIAKELIEDKKFYVDFQKCPMMIEEIGFWHYPKRKAGVQYDNPEIPVDDFDHTMSAMRYSLSNIHALEKSHTTGIPTATGDPQETAKRLQDLRDSLPGNFNMPNTEKWRLSLGGPIANPNQEGMARPW